MPKASTGPGWPPLVSYQSVYFLMFHPRFPPLRDTQIDTTLIIITKFDFLRATERIVIKFNSRGVDKTPTFKTIVNGNYLRAINFSKRNLQLTWILTNKRAIWFDIPYRITNITDPRPVTHASEQVKVAADPGNSPAIISGVGYVTCTRRVTGRGTSR